MTLIADANIPDPVVAALQAVQLDIRRLSEIGKPSMPDRVVMQLVRDMGGILVTMDLGIPSQAYFFEFAKGGLTVVQLRWKTSTPGDWQQMVEVISRDADYWHQVAMREPSVISVSYRRGSRVRPWSQLPPEIGGRARGRHAP